MIFNMNDILKSTIKFNYTLYKKFWNLIISQSNKYSLTATIEHVLHRAKMDKELDITEYHLINNCINRNLACQYAFDSREEYCINQKTNMNFKFEYPDNGIEYCNWCPFKINNPNGPCLDGLYNKWMNCTISNGPTNLELYNKYALEILNFEVKNNVLQI